MSSFYTFQKAESNTGASTAAGPDWFELVCDQPQCSSVGNCPKMEYPKALCSHHLPYSNCHFELYPVPCLGNLKTQSIELVLSRSYPLINYIHWYTYIYIYVYSCIYHKISRINPAQITPLSPSPSPAIAMPFLIAGSPRPDAPSSDDPLLEDPLTGWDLPRSKPRKPHGGSTDAPNELQY